MSYDANRVEEDVVLVRLFIEGVYFPYLEHISVSEGEGKVSGTITIPASPKLKAEHFVGKKVHAFYANLRVLEKFGEDPGAGSLSRWPILLQGEISGLSQGASVSSRSVSFRIVGHSRHFAQNLLYFWDANRDKDLDGLQQAAFLGSKKIQFETSGVLSKTTRLTEALRQAMELAGEDQDRFVAYQATLRVILSEAATSHGAFRLFSDQLSLDRRFGAFVDPDVRSVLTLEQWASMIDKTVAALPNYTPIQQLLDTAAEMMRYTWVHVSQPRYVKSAEPATKSAFDDVEGARVRDTYRALKRELERIRQQYRSRSDIQPGTTYSIKTLLGPFYVGLPYLASEKAGGLIYLSEQSFVEAVEQRLADQGGRVFEAAKAIIDGGFWPGSTYEPVREDGKKITAQSIVAAEEARGSEAKAALKDNLLQQKLIARQLDLLHEWLSVPDMTLSMPPRCNVFGPHLIEGYSLSLDYFSEITRLYVKARFTDSNYEWYIAPSTGVFYHVNDGNNIDVVGDAFDRLTPEDQRKVETGLPGSEEDDDEV